MKLSRTRNIESRPLNVLYPLEESVFVHKSIEGAKDNVGKVFECESGPLNKEKSKAAPQPSETEIDDNVTLYLQGVL